MKKWILILFMLLSFPAFSKTYIKVYSQCTLTVVLQGVLHGRAIDASYSYKVFKVNGKVQLHVFYKYRNKRNLKFLKEFATSMLKLRPRVFNRKYKGVAYYRGRLQSKKCNSPVRIEYRT